MKGNSVEKRKKMKLNKLPKFHLHVKILFLLIFMRHEKIKRGYFVLPVKTGAVLGCVTYACLPNDKSHVIHFI